MNRMISAALLGAATAAASWAVSRWLARREAAPPPLEGWENEGGALAPESTRVETSQVPRS